MADGTAAADTAFKALQFWPPVAADTFRDSLAKLASGLAIIACWDRGQPRGLLVSSVTGLSTEPPRMLFCVRKAASAHDALLRAETVSLSILADDDRLEAERFSRSDLTEGRFGPEAWRLVSGEPPAHKSALVALAGPVRSRIDAGSHTVFILDVSTAQARDGEPLLYFQRDFRKLA